MDPNYSVLIFSKYSANCKKLFEFINNSGINFDKNKLQLLCIDNEKIRNRIKNNGKIDIISVPCILSVFSTGGVEKYDGMHAFAWTENFILQFAPPKPPTPPSPPPQMQPPPQPRQQRRNVKIKELEELENTDDENEDQSQVQDRIQDKRKIRATSIDDIPLEEENDRHITKPPPRRIRHDENTYIEDENLFSGEATDSYREQSKPSDKKDSVGIREKADALAKGRDIMENQINNKNKRPIGDRAP